MHRARSVPLVCVTIACLLLGALLAADDDGVGATCDTTATRSEGGDDQVDECVCLDGPECNLPLDAWTGPDMRFGTLEDIYGDTGNRFQAAVGMLAFESEDTTTPEVSYGISIDDMVVEWREYQLVKEDPAQTCANGECATVDLQVDEFYQGSSILTITVLEKSPPAANDCDQDGTPDGTTDCDSDGVRDLVVRASPEQVDPDEEIVACNLVSGYEYKADIPVSISYDSPGVVFVKPIGVDVAKVNVLYFDADDGTGQICKNHVDPLAYGFVEGTTQVLIDRSNVVLVFSVLDEVIGDGDGWADTNETVRMAVQLGNRTDFALQGVTARLLTNDDKIACISNASIEVGDIPAQANKWSYLQSNGWFEFIVGDIQRTGFCTDDTTVCSVHTDCTGIGAEKCDAAVQPFSAEFSVLVGGDTFEAAYSPQTIILDLDLDGVGGSGPTDYYEGFEPPYETIGENVHRFNTFTTMHLDYGMLTGDPLINSQGWRCQYSDPEWRNSNSYGGGSTDCFVGPTQAGVDAYYWQVQDGDATFGPEKVGKAYADRYSMYFGAWHPGGPDGGQWTTPTGGIEAIVTREPINIGFNKTCDTTPQFCITDDDCPGLETCTPVAPELSFKHQVSFVDGRNLSTGWYKSGGGGVIQVRVADIDGNPVGDWVKLQPYQNVYDQQRYQWYFSCFFDPIDDGNTEDDFFDPTDPNRRYGPSSLCYPELIWARMGETDLPYGSANLGYADGPGLRGSKPDDPTKQGGTWVESVFNLQRYRGQRFFMRFLQGQMKIGENDTYQDIVGFNLQDDGWWIDDILLTDTLAEAVEVVADTKANTSDCGTFCTTVTPALEADPAGVLGAPGQAVELNAAGSTSDRCVDGTLQYLFCNDLDLDDTCDEPGEVIRGWTDNPTIVLAPTASTTYLAKVRCATATECNATAKRRVQVFCPSTGNLGLYIRASAKTAMNFNGSYSYHYCEGAQASMPSYTCDFANHPATAGPATSHTLLSADPAVGSFNYFLFREPGAIQYSAYCNVPGITWGQCQSSPTRDEVLP